MNYNTEKRSPINLSHLRKRKKKKRKKEEIKDLFLFFLRDESGLTKEFLLLSILQAKRERFKPREAGNLNTKIRNEKRDTEYDRSIPREQLPRLGVRDWCGSARRSTCGVGWDRRGDAMAFG